MAINSRENILQTVTNYYLKSRDFNGTPFNSVSLPGDGHTLIIRKLVRDGLLSINFGDIHPNPHIMAFEPEPIKVQLEKLKKNKLKYACLYPTKKYLDRMVNKSSYSDKPFTLMLALGEPSLGFRVFDPNVLELYRNDPRYNFDTDDVHGSLSVKFKYFENGKLRKRDNIFIQTFGFAYNKSLSKRAVAVYIYYLSGLSAEHQQFWYGKMLKGKYFLHPDYYRSTMGDFPDKVSIFTAFIEELHHINKMSSLMGRPMLFKEEYREDKKPRGFGFLLRPTLKEFNDFCHLLDKMVSENINKDFFKNDIPLNFEETLSGNKIKIIPKGSLVLLEEWLSRVHFPDPVPKNRMIKVFRSIRKLRQPPAHKVEEDIFNQKYFSKQRKLVIDAYSAIRTLRLIFANHPRVKGYKDIPDWLFKGDIRAF